VAAQANRMAGRNQPMEGGLSQGAGDYAHGVGPPPGRLRQKAEVVQASSEATSSGGGPIDAALLETDNILETFSALLRIAQIESGTRTAGFREIDLSKTFESVAEAFSVVSEDEGKSLTTNI